jgi:predicted Zn-dependent peptidase
VREHPQRLEAVTTEEAAAVAAEFLAPARFTGVVVTDAATTAASLTALGGIRVPGESPIS